MHVDETCSMSWLLSLKHFAHSIPSTVVFATAPCLPDPPDLKKVYPQCQPVPAGVLAKARVDAEVMQRPFVLPEAQSATFWESNAGLNGPCMCGYRNGHCNRGMWRCSTCVACITPRCTRAATVHLWMRASGRAHASRPGGVHSICRPSDACRSHCGLYTLWAVASFPRSARPCARHSAGMPLQAFYLLWTDTAIASVQRALHSMAGSPCICHVYIHVLLHISVFRS